MQNNLTEELFQRWQWIDIWKKSNILDAHHNSSEGFFQTKWEDQWYDAAAGSIVVYYNNMKSIFEHYTLYEETGFHKLEAFFIKSVMPALKKTRSTRTFRYFQTLFPICCILKTEIVTQYE